MQHPLRLPVLTTLAAFASLLPPVSPLRAQTAPLPPAVDRDGDGHSDLWQLFHNIPDANGGEDSDGDGVPDREEEKAGTNPWSSLSYPAVSGLEILPDGRGGRMARLRWNALAGKRYQISSAPDFSAAASSWQPTGEAFLAGEDGMMSADFLLPAGETRRFFRAAVMDVDADGDGLSAFEEKRIGTSDSTPNSGGAGAAHDTETAMDWANKHDPGIDSGAPKASLREVAVTFVRKNEASGAAEIVTATGSGAWHQLSSWRAGAGNPSHLFTAPPLDGHHPKLLPLTPAKNAAAPKFLSGRIRPDGSLWLSTRSLAAGSGAFVHHHSKGWTPGAGQDVVEYDMAAGAVSSRTAGVTHYQVVTVLRLRSRQEQNPMSLHVLTWNVDAQSGAVTFLKDNSPFVSPGFATEPRIRVTHVSGSQFETVFTSPDGKQVHQPLWVDAQGNAFGDATTGLRDIRGAALSSAAQQASAISGLSSSGYLTAMRQPDGALRMIVWDRRPEPGAPGIFVPHHLTDHGQDLLPQQAGVGINAPLLRDSFPGLHAAGDGTAAAMATGDFNGDGYADAALGSPGRDVGNAPDAGAVFVLHGGAEGIQNIEQNQSWDQSSPGVPGDPAGGDNFGGALAAGDFNGDGNDDLAVGIPMKNVNGQAGAGAVQVLYGTPFGLSGDKSQLLTRGSLGQAPAAQDSFGVAVTTGDFNHDGFEDLAIGAPGESVSGKAGAGAVHVLWGSASGLTTGNSAWLHQDSSGLADEAEAGDAFGRALSSGDFNGDKHSDLAVGVPQEDVAGKTDAGAVQIVYGSGGADGFGGSNFVTREGFSGGSDIAGTPAANDLFGWSLATGDFNKDTAGDLAIGVPGDSVLGVNSGAVQVLHGTILGLTWINNEIIRGKGNLPDAQSLPQFGQANEDLGWSLAAGDCDGDGFKDLIASAPGKSFNNKSAAGAMFVIKGSATGLQPATAVMMHQDITWKETDPKKPSDPATNQTADKASAANDKFASALICADFNSDGEADVVAGIPRKDDDDIIGCGAAHFFQGSPEYSLTLRTDFQWVPKRRELVRGIITDLTRENAGGAGSGKLYSHNELLPAVHMASSTKTMTLLLAVEAIEDGLASLDDDVTASLLAGTTGGSKLDTLDPNFEPKEVDGEVVPFVQPQDKMKLRFYLAAMMGESCNRSSVAIGQHISTKVTGNPDNFVKMMHERAKELGMTDSVFGHPAGGWVTHLQDTVTLQREGVKHPLFVKFSSFEIYGDDQPEEILCGTDIEGKAKCNNPWKQFTSLGSYPGRHTWKGGNGGLWWSDGQAAAVPARPEAAWCTASRVTTALRMDRILASCLQQTGSGDEDAQRLMDYGYRKLFTPDLRAGREFPEAGGIVGPEGPVRVRNFAITAWDGHGLSAVIDDNEELRLNVWTIDYKAGSLSPAGNVKKSYPLLPGLIHQEPALVDLARVPVPVSTAIADFFTANLIGERLELQAWRIGEEP